MQGKASYGECCRELSIEKLRVAYGRPYSRNLGLFRSWLTEQEMVVQVAAGDKHSMALTAVGELYA